jgi:hypothetical protein
MKKISLLLSSLLISSCVSDSGLNVRTREFSGAVCENCPVVRVTIPEATGGGTLGKSVNTAVREEIIELLDYDQESDARDIPGAIDAFQEGFQKLQEDFPEELTGWEASVEAMKTYEDQFLLTIEMNTYIFTGGAHGYPATRFLNFEKKTGKELDANDLLKDRSAFSDFAETAFRKQYQIAADAPINSTGFMFEEDRFELPQNMGLTAEGLVLHYNPYEAASYADGALVLKFPLEEIRSFLSWEP